MKVVGLTGGIGTGKSTVARILREQGLPVVDADLVARDVVAPGRPALDEIRRVFGPQVLHADGALNRAAMRRRIAENPLDRRRLEAITHPAILGAITEQLVALSTAGQALAFVEAALMVETGSYRLYHGLLVVTCAPDTQLQRVLARDAGTEAEARALIATQLPLADKEAAASWVIRNDGTLEELRERTLAVLAEIRAA